mgnify:CR=1 FL=1
MPFKEISGLREPFKSAARYLLWIIKKEELPFIVFETLRDEATQESYFKRGVTKARFGESPHNYGYAMDVVLDVKKIKTRKREWKGRNFPDAWDDETPDCVEAWFLLGGYVEDLQLTWGGTWMSLPTRLGHEVDLVPIIIVSLGLRTTNRNLKVRHRRYWAKEPAVFKLKEKYKVASHPLRASICFVELCLVNEN